MNVQMEANVFLAGQGWKGAWEVTQTTSGQDRISTSIYKNY